MRESPTIARIGQITETTALLDEDGLWLLIAYDQEPTPLAAMEQLAKGQTDILDDHFSYLSADTNPVLFEKITGNAVIVAELTEDGKMTLHTSLMNNPTRQRFGLPTRHPDMPEVVESDGTLEAGTRTGRRQSALYEI